MTKPKRKVAFSGKKKYEQIKNKNALKANKPSWTDEIVNENDTLPKSVNVVKTVTPRNRYAMYFSKEYISNDAKKFEMHQPILDDCVKNLECQPSDFFPSYLDYPKRPKWSYEMSKETLDMREETYIREFIQKYQDDYSDIGLYEENLETWRQLWRVCEMSHVLLIIVDVKFAVVQFPPYLYYHLSKELKKGIILVLNKCDTVPECVINSIKEYFCYNFPEILVVPFISGYKMTNTSNFTENTLQLINTIKQSSKLKVDYDEWIRKIHGKSVTGNSENENSKEILTLGTIGHPNVGKSSFINGIMGKKVVSVSRTPGHTKHFQTIYLTKQIILCDCPGLVFPCTTPFPIQVLMGSYPIAQVRNPMTVIGYISKYLNVPKILKLQIAEASSGATCWTPFLISEAYAVKLNLYKNKGGADAQRAANFLLRQIVGGNSKVVFYLPPPGYCDINDYDTSTNEVRSNKIIEEKKSQVSEYNSEDEDSIADSTGDAACSNRFANLDLSNLSKTERLMHKRNFHI